jgi:hypothetical protein
MADNKVIELQKEILKLTKVIKDNGTATKEQSKQLDKLEKQYQRLSGKIMPQYRKRHDEVNDALKNSKKITSELDKANKGFFGRLKTAVGTLLRYSLAYRAINAGQQLLNELFIQSSKRAIRLEKALADVAAIANLTSTEIEKLEKVVFDVAGTTSLTATEVVELQKQLAKLGTSVSDIEELTRPIALLSQALGEDAGGVAAALKKTLNQFQATTEEADRFANVLVGAVNETALSLNDLGTALQYVGPLAAQSGVSFEQTASLLGILADNGFRASRAGTGLRNVLLESAKSGIPFSEFLEDLAEKNLDVARATDLFGKRGASAAIVLSNNIEKFKDLSIELEDSNRLFIANAKQMSTTQGQIDLLSSAYDKFSTNLGEAITQTNFFINVLAILDKEASGLAGAYKILSEETEKTKELTEELVDSFRDFSKGDDNPITQSEALGKAIRLVGEEGDFAKSTIDETYSLLLFYLKQGKDLQEAFAIASEKTGRGQLRLLTTTRELVNLLYEQSKGLDEAFISQEANNETVKRYKNEYAGLLSLTREGVNVDKEKQELQTQLNADTLSYANELEQLRGKIGALSQEEEERARILEKRIALLSEQSEKIGKLAVDEETLANKRKKADKQEQERLKSELSDYIERIKETEKVIEDLRVEVGASAFPTQVDLLDGFFGGAEDIIAEATKRFGADSKFVKGLIKTFRDTADEVSVQLPKEAGEPIQLALKGLFGKDGLDFVKYLAPEQAKSLAEKLREAFEDVKLADVIAEGLDKAAESIAEFNAVALENTKGRLEAEKSAISNRYETENDILKSQLDNQLITESQFRVKQQELQRAKIAEENDIDKKIFEAEKKQDRQNATTDYLQSLASIIPNLIIYDKEGNPVKLAIKSAISAGLTTAAYGAELAAIGQKKFFPKKFAEGGMVSGPSHDQGGVPFSVQGQSGYEMEGGEYVINKRATAMHRDLLERINKSGMTRPRAGSYKFAEGGLVSSPLNESVDYLKAIAEATTSTAIGVSKPVRAYVADKDLRTDSTERRIRDRNDRI